MNGYLLEKPTWDESDFSGMGWHDVTIWSISADPDRYEFLVDMDYILKWVDPSPNETHYKFWIAPVTMVFENVHSICMDLESHLGTFEISALHRENPEVTPNGKLTQHSYRFECQEGEIKLRATGFKMFVRATPVLTQQQSLSLLARGGIGFARALDAT